MKLITFTTAKELKQATRTGFNYTPKFDVSQILTINGYKLKSLNLEITNKHVSIYDVPKQNIIFFNSPFTLEILES